MDPPCKRSLFSRASGTVNRLIIPFSIVCLSFHDTTFSVERRGSRLSVKLWLLVGFDDNKTFRFKTRSVSHWTGGLAIYISKYLRAKEELWKLKYFTMQKYINLQTIL